MFGDAADTIDDTISHIGRAFHHRADDATLRQLMQTPGPIQLTENVTHNQSINQSDGTTAPISK